jgi:C-terminal processing protease CtpA/Prc
VCTGITIDVADKGINGCYVVTRLPTGLVGLDNRIQLGDYVTKINNESLRGVTGAQARSILKRASLIGTDIT